MDTEFRGCVTRLNPITDMVRRPAYLVTAYPLSWRNLSRSWAFSLSLAFSLAVRVS